MIYMIYKFLPKFKIFPFEVTVYTDCPKKAPFIIFKKAEWYFITPFLIMKYKSKKHTIDFYLTFYLSMYVAPFIIIQQPDNLANYLTLSQ